MPTAVKSPVHTLPCCSQARVIDLRVRRVLQTIQSAPSCDAAGLAQMVGLSNSRLSHLFKLETGQDLRSFLTQCRLDRAAQLLQNAETPVKEISYLVGYRHTASFIRAFHKRFGCAPQDYRNAGNFSVGIADSAN